MKTFPRLMQANKALQSRLDGLQTSKVPAIVFDFAFAPHNHYHMITAFPIAELLRRDGLSVSFLDFTDVNRDEGVQKAVASLRENECHDISQFIAAGHDFRNLVVFNDWDPRTTYPLVLDARDAGASTVGIVEGINDFNDIDTGRRRDAYRTVDWVLGAGENDRQYFADNKQTFKVVGFPRIAESLKQPYRAPTHARAAINVNFTYNVLEDKRDEWLESAIEGCRLANMDWVISRHPADKGDLSNYPLDPRSFEELMHENAILVSRFSSCIIEALAMGRAVVYHNPGVEKVEKFVKPLGAYSVSNNALSLARSLQFEMDHQGSVLERRNSFLAEHCDYSPNFDPYSKTARALKDIHATRHRSPQRPASVPTNNQRGYMYVQSPIVTQIRKWLITPTAAALVAGMTLICMSLSGLSSHVLLASTGLVLVGLVVAKESILWRWRRERDRERSAARLDGLQMVVRENRTRAAGQTKNALAAERHSAQKALTSALAAERHSAQKALASALAAERASAQKALTSALAVERASAQKALDNVLAAERRNAQKALSNALGAERNLAERRLARALVAERSRGSSVDGHLTGQRSKVPKDGLHTHEHRRTQRPALMIGKSIYRPQDRYGNTGNMVHQAAAQKIIGEFDHYDMDNYLLDEQVEEIEASNSHLVVVLANDIRIGTNATPLAHLHDIRYNNIARIELPVVVLGLGAQAPSDFPSSEEIFIPSETRRLLRLLSDRSRNVAVRGERTADIMHRVGIDNVTVTGCQSAFWNLSPHFPHDLTDMGRPGSGDIAYNSTYMDRECYLIRFAIDQGFHLIGQSHFREEDIIFDRPVGDEYTESERKVFASGVYSQETYEAYIRNHFQKFYDLDRWCDAIRAYRLMWGSRLHGCMLALQMGTPALWVTHDLRTEEVCEHHSLPSVNLEQAESFRHVDDIRKAMDYAIFLQRYPENYAIMHDYLERSGVQHQLPRPQ